MTLWKRGNESCLDAELPWRVDPAVGRVRVEQQTVGAVEAHDAREHE